MDGTFSCVIAPCRVLNIGYPVATRPVLPVQASSPAGVHPVVSAAVTAGARLARWQAVERPCRPEDSEELTRRSNTHSPVPPAGPRCPAAHRQDELTNLGNLARRAIAADQVARLMHLHYCSLHDGE